MRSIEREELAWAAGFFDGEGYVGCTPYPSKGKRYAPGLKYQASIRQTDPWVLHRFQRAVGVGHVHGPYQRASANHRPTWQYQTAGVQNVQAVMAMLWRWLGPVKRAQARAVLLRMRQRQDRRRDNRDASLVRTLFGKAVKQLTTAERADYDRARKGLYGDGDGRGVRYGHNRSGVPVCAQGA